jgi:cytochrome c-type biogenesis protein
MQQTAPLKSLSFTQRVLLGIALVVIAFVILGSLLQPETNPAASMLPTQSFLVMAVLAFAGGVLSFASPCTLPILPAYFAFAFQSGRRQIATNTIFFMLGLATMFSLLGAGASFIGRFLNDSADLLLLFGGSLIVVFGLMSLMGKGFTGFQTRGESSTARRWAALTCLASPSRSAGRAAPARSSAPCSPWQRPARPCCTA